MKPLKSENEEHTKADDQRIQEYMDLRKVLQEDDLLTYSSYIQGQMIVVTIFTFDIPLKQLKIDLSNTNLQITEKETNE